jgi:hypothetical protein
MTGELERLKDRVYRLETRLFERKAAEFAEGRTS